MAGTVEQAGGYNFSIKGKTKFQLVKPGAQLSIGDLFNERDKKREYKSKTLKISAQVYLKK